MGCNILAFRREMLSFSAEKNTLDQGNIWSAICHLHPLNHPPVFLEEVLVANASIWVVCDGSEYPTKATPQKPTLYKEKQRTTPVSTTVNLWATTADLANVILSSSPICLPPTSSGILLQADVKGFWTTHGTVQQSKWICLHSTQEAGERSGPRSYPY